MPRHTRPSPIQAVALPARRAPMLSAPLLCAAFGMLALTALGLYFAVRATLDAI